MSLNSELLLFTDSSLDWESLEQYFLWQLIAAHNIPLEYVLPVLNKFDYSQHAEALTCFMIQLKQKQ